jgi:uncharacterized membrane protein
MMSDQEMDEIIGGLLRWGVILAASVVGIGGVWYLIRHGSAAPAYHVFLGEPSDLRSLRGVIRAIPELHPRTIIQLGVLLLIATPVARVAFSIVAFFLQRDRTYVVITTIVLAVLLFSLV